MNTKHLKARILDLALQGKLVENSRIPNDLNSRIPSDFNPPFEIPNTWSWVKLGDLGDIITGSTPPKANKEYYGDDYPFYKPSDLDAGIQVENSTDKISKKGFEISRKLPQNSILVTCIGTIGKTGLILKEGICNQQINAILPNEKFISKFLFFAITSEFFQNEIKQNSSSTTLPILNKSKFSNLYIPLPPKDEQEIIVKKIDKLFEQIDILETSKQNLLKNIKQAKARILDLALQGKLVENSKISKKSNFGIPNDFKPPFGIPNSWQWVKLGDICEIIRGGSPRPIKEFLTTKNDGLNWIKISDSDIGGKYIISAKEKIIKEGLSKTRFVKSGSLLLTNSMSFGRPYILKIDGCIHDGWLVLNNFEKFACINFLYFLISSDFIQKSFRFSASGSTVSNLSTDKVKDTYIPLPPKDEQERIVKKIDELFEILESIQNSL